MSKHTPGPWLQEAPGRGETTWIIQDEPGNDLAEVFAIGDCPAEANARLIAAAPELLELVRCWADDVLPAERYTAVRALLNRIDGK